MNLIEFNKVSFSYQTESLRVDVLSEFECQVLPGEYLAIVGPSGSGKSTLLNLAAGFIVPREGNVLVCGEDVPSSGQKANIYRNNTIGYIFQSFNLIPSMTALENVMVPLLISGKRKPDARHKALKQLEELGIAQRAEHLPNQLSGGEQQRVAIARAIINGAKLILADEPTGNLDKGTTEMISQILCDLHTQGRTIMLVTHDSEMTMFADRVLELSKL